VRFILGPFASVGAILVWLRNSGGPGAVEINVARTY